MASTAACRRVLAQPHSVAGCLDIATHCAGGGRSDIVVLTMMLLWVAASYARASNAYSPDKQLELSGMLILACRGSCWRQASFAQLPITALALPESADGIVISPMR